MIPEKEVPTPTKVQSLQRTLYRKAKENPRWRAWSLYGDLLRRDVLETALATVLRNGGAAGVDRVTAEAVEANASAFLDGLQRDYPIWRMPPFRLTEAKKCYERALAMDNGVLEPQMRVHILRRLANLVPMASDVRLSLLRHREAYALSCDIGDRRLEAECLVDVGACLLHAGDLGGSRELTSALKLARELELVPVISRALVFFAIHKERSGDLESAEVIVAGLDSQEFGVLVKELDSVRHRLGGTNTAKPMALEMLADELIAEYRSGSPPA